MFRGICPQNIFIASGSGSCLSRFVGDATAAEVGEEEDVGTVEVVVAMIPVGFMIEKKRNLDVVRDEEKTWINKTRRVYEKTGTNIDEQRRRPSQGDKTKNENEGTTKINQRNDVFSSSWAEQKSLGRMFGQNPPRKKLFFLWFMRLSLHRKRFQHIAQKTTNQKSNSLTNQPTDVYSVYKPWYYKYEQNNYQYNMQSSSSLSETARCR